MGSLNNPAGRSQPVRLDGRPIEPFSATNIAASVFQAINPVFIITLAPVFAALWTGPRVAQFPAGCR